MKIYKFSSSHCGPCRMVKPIWDKISTQFPTVKFIEFVVDKEPEASPYVDKFRVNGVPAFIITDDNDNVLHTWHGFTPEKKFVEELNKFI